ncbi:MAG: alanine--tRNA ligase [Phycisphaerae bacterium]|nr:alanine--tRNA ligase [Phycisphaerae bacterium]
MVSTPSATDRASNRASSSLVFIFQLPPMHGLREFMCPSLRRNEPHRIPQAVATRPRYTGTPGRGPRPLPQHARAPEQGSRDVSAPMTAAEVREGFIEFFKERAGHAYLASSAVIPHDDPTLLFTNAGMNQFKDVFLGLGSRETTRAVNSQKCIRAGGKHNDLEDVGTDTYHHTFFEMLGNWSFGDYFKAEAIKWAWELLTDTWGLDKDRLYVTVFEGDPDDGTGADEESERLWRELTDIDPSHISRWGRKDNFWEMGAAGPCGPCTEIHYDSTPDASGGDLVNKDHPDVIEIWNLVFIEFNRQDDGSLVPLPARHVDTGMGFERIVRVLQGKRSNYDTDLWTPLFKAIESRTGSRPYGGGTDDPVDIAYRVLADHARCLVVALSDGGRPGNEGRSYVLRRILRRGVRLARQVFEVEGPVICDLVPAVVESLGETYPEIARDPDAVADIIRGEEEAFLRTLDRGLERFAAAEEAVRASGGNVIDGETAFQLHDTFGFPIDLTEVMAIERGLVVDREAYEERMEEARTRSRGTGEAESGLGLPPDALASLEDRVPPTSDDGKFDMANTTGRIKAAWNGSEFIDAIPTSTTIGLVLDETNFYAEQGGQVADTGRAGGFEVHDVLRFGDWVLHVGSAVGEELNVGDSLDLHVDAPRRLRIEANHTSTHLLNHALREVLGDDVEQRGSLVADDRLRFDYAQGSAPAPSDLASIEQRVVEAIKEDLAVHAAEVPLESARAITGVRAVFGEQYPDPVRVVSIGATVEDLVASPSDPAWRNHSIEFCGGTHLDSTASAGGFVLLSDQALAAGIRRIVALSGDRAVETLEAGRTLLEQAKSLASLDGDELADSHARLASAVESGSIGVVHKHEILELLEAERKRVRDARKQAANQGIDAVLEQARAISSEASGDFIVGTLSGASRDGLMAALDHIRGSHEQAGCLLLAELAESGKVAIVARVPESLNDRGLKAGDWVRETAKACGGSGGGRADMAQAGGKDPGRIPEAAERATNYASEVLA